MAARVKTRPTFRSCSTSWPSRVSTSGRRPRLEWSQSSSPRSLRPLRCARCSPSSRWRPGDERQRDARQPDGRLSYFEDPLDGNWLAGGVRLLFPRRVVVAGSFKEGTAGCQPAPDDLLVTRHVETPGGGVRRLPAVLHQLGN